MRPLIVILGPTASGKSALGVVLAQQLGGEVLACDSTQVYRGFDIGTAKPSTAERGGVPHHLMDLAEPDDIFTAGEYRRRALAVLDDLAGRERLPILTAGTGLYLRALLEGLADSPERSERVRARLAAITERRGHTYLHRLLSRIDPPSAARISPNDRQKLIRAIEICVVARKPLSEVHRAGREPLQDYAPIKIGLSPPRPLLQRRIAERFQSMLDRGWLSEVTALLAADPKRSAKPFDFIGYRELREHLLGRLTLDQAADATTIATRQYAKRQVTWFRKEANVTWFEGFGDDPGITSAVLRAVQDRLNKVKGPPAADRV